MSFTQKERVELEEITSFNRPTETSTMLPRWQRKALAPASPSKPVTKTPSKATPKSKGTPKVRAQRAAGRARDRAPSSPAPGACA
jgi:hypothetical protein